MLITDIVCTCYEYSLSQDGVWVFNNIFQSCINTDIITSMIEAGKYFRAYGGKQIMQKKFIEKLGNCITKISCISTCGTVQKIYIFNYNSARRY